MENIMVVGEKKKHLKQMVDTIYRRSNHEFTVKSFTKTSDLNKASLCGVENIRLILLSLSGRTDPPWDIWFLRRRFPCAKVVVEMDADAPERARKMLLWGASKTFIRNEDAWEVIKHVCKP
jgi:hypothetical protein